MAKQRFSIVLVTLILISCGGCATHKCCRRTSPVPVKAAKRWKVPPIPPWGYSHYYRNQVRIAKANNAKIDREAEESKRRAE